MSQHDSDWAYEEHLQEQYEEKLIRDSISNISLDAARSYLGKYGDAVDARVKGCLAESEALLKATYSGPALAIAATALELMIRFLVLRPLVQGAFLSDEWAAILARRVATGRSGDDRKLLPDVLSQWNIDISDVHTAADVPVWDFVVRVLWPSRDRFVHQYEPVPRETVATALDCIRAFREHVVGAVGNILGFSLAETGRWSEIRGTSRPEVFRSDDPFAERRG